MTTLNSGFYDHPALYDALLPATAHVFYYVDLARQAFGDVLELACGTGQLTVPIASAGLPTVGLDLSAPMLATARQRAATAKVSIEYVLGDMRNFDLGRKFALIFIARNSLLHLHSTEDLLAAFAAVRRHMAPGGIFAFDVFNPNVRLLARPSGQRFPVFEVETESFGKLSVEGTTDYDPATQVGRGRWYISAPENPDAWVVDLELRNIFPQELPLLLEAGGLHLKSRMGDLSQTPFDSTSRFQVCLCQATV
ncbi:MAG TPA: class I SAM-dependent methyltransferase [Bryobacteraceae bacterium]|nr:class I SAM-dependent methyltransferase [Bryobacteraceae bacterium]